MLFIARDKEKLHRNLPLLPVGVEPPGVQTLKRIHIRYARDEETLRKLVTCIPLLEFTPTLVIIDGLSSFFRQFGCALSYFCFAFEVSGPKTTPWR